jgi:hypothetical protein
MRDARLAARHGAPAVTEHVRALVRAEAFPEYWRELVVPCLDAGFRPPVLEGWRRFLATPEVAEYVSERLANGPDVLARVQELAPRDGAAGEPFEAELPLDGLERLALREGGDLVEIGWDRVAEAVWLPRLLSRAEAARDVLAGRTVAELPDLAEEGVPQDVLTAALTVSLSRAGWVVELEPSGRLTAHSESFVVHPLLVPVDELDDDEDWDAMLEETGIAGLPLALPAVAPADRLPLHFEPASLALPRTAGLRRGTVLLLAVVGPLGLALCSIFVGVALFNPSPPARLVFGVMGVAVTAGFGWWMLWRWRLAFSRGSLSIGPTGLEVADRGLLREPMRIPRELVRAVADDHGEAISQAGNPLRFPYGESPWLHPSGRDLSAQGWLWQGARDPSVPLLGAGDEIPNLLIVFAEPVPAPRLRLRWRREGLPRRGRALRALALRVDDAHRAEAAFRGWEVVRPLSAEDAA